MSLDNYALSRIIARRKAIEKNNQSSPGNKDLIFFKRMIKHKKELPKKKITEEFTHGTFWDKNYDPNLYTTSKGFKPAAYVKRTFKIGNKIVKLSFKEYLEMDYDKRERFIDDVLQQKYGFEYIDFKDKKAVDDRLKNASLEEHLRYINALIALSKSDSMEYNFESKDRLNKAYYAIQRLLPPKEK